MVEGVHRTWAEATGSSRGLRTLAIPPLLLAMPIHIMPDELILAGLPRGSAGPGVSSRPQQREGLHRIAREALHNDPRQGHVLNVTVCLRQDRRTATLVVSADGPRADPAHALQRTRLALSALKERAA
jgi:hypothetical protein